MDLSLGDVSLLLLLRQAKEETGTAQVRMSDISSELGVSRPAATQIVARLCDRGIIERIKSDDDRRSVYVRPTERAVSMIYGKMNDRLSALDKALDEMGEQNVDLLLSLLDRLYLALDSQLQKEELP
jgi:DNA-binding MarR family transcriptional regulator